MAGARIPEGAGELNDPVSRRHFVKIMSASFMLAGLGLSTGCRKPEERNPALRQGGGELRPRPASVFRDGDAPRAGAIPLVVKSHEGRPIKIEGNPLYPGRQWRHGSLRAASDTQIYTIPTARRVLPNAAATANCNQRPARRGWLFGELAGKLQQAGGEGFSFLTEPATSPSRRRLQNSMRQKFPKARWFSYDPIDRRASMNARQLRPSARRFAPCFVTIGEKRSLSLDCDFIGAEEDAHNTIRRFAKGRKVVKAGDAMSRLYAVESLFTLTGLNADHRLRLPASAVIQVAAAIAAECGVSLSGIAKPAADHGEVDFRCAKICCQPRCSSRGRGHGQPLRFT